jgi:hypothetical protein
MATSTIASVTLSNALPQIFIRLGTGA